MTDETQLVPTYPGGPLITPAERAAVKAAANQHVQAVFDTRRMTAEINGPVIDADYLLDPNHNARMRERADSIMRHLQTSRDITYVDHGEPRYDLRQHRYTPRRYDAHDPDEQGRCFVHYVSQPNAVHVYPSRPKEHMWYVTAVWPEGRCNVRESAACTGIHGGTVYLALHRGQYVVVWETCSACFAHLQEVALGGEILAEAGARVDFDAKAQAVVAKWRAIRAEQEGHGDA